MTTRDAGTGTRVDWKVTIDHDVCQGYACCVMAVPSVFDLDDETGKATVTASEPDDSLRSEVEGAVRGCPVRAIRIVAR